MSTSFLSGHLKCPIQLLTAVYSGRLLCYCVIKALNKATTFAVRRCINLSERATRIGAGWFLEDLILSVCLFSARHQVEDFLCASLLGFSGELSELNDELPGAVVIIDTLTRFVEGDQNSSEDMARFAQEVFRLKRLGATVLLLHHSIKGASGGPLTLDSAMRGSSELAAFVTSCWATRLKDPDDPYNSSSLLANVKQRDYESLPFAVTSDATCRMRIVGEPGQIAETKSKKDAEAEQVLASLLKDTPRLGINKLQEGLRAAGHKKGVKWVTLTRAALKGTGVTLAAS